MKYDGCIEFGMRDNPLLQMNATGKTMKLSKLTYSLVLAGLLAGCQWDSSPDSQQNLQSAKPLRGNVVKGPLAKANVDVYKLDYAASNLKGELVAQGSTNIASAITGISLSPSGAPYLVVTTANADTIDITTGLAPEITTMQTIVTAKQLEAGSSIYPTPLTSMAVEAVAKNKTTKETLQHDLNVAQGRVKSSLGFGLKPEVDIFTTSPVLNNRTQSTESQNKVIAYRLAVEAASAVVINTAKAQNTKVSDVLRTLSQDLADGNIDGNIGGQPQSLAAKVKDSVAKADVNTLKVPGTNTPVKSITSVLSKEVVEIGTSTVLKSDVVVDAKPIALAPDSDGDGLIDSLDNCDLVANNNDADNQIDQNNNGVGAACEVKPIAINQTKQIDEDEFAKVPFTLKGADPEGDVLKFKVVEVDGKAANISIQANASGDFIYEYAVTKHDNGTKTIKFTVDDEEVGGVSEEGVLTLEINPVSDPTTGNIEISGSTNDGQKLTVKNNLSDPDGKIEIVSYQWLANGLPIDNATGAELLLTNDLIGKQISVKVTFNDGSSADQNIQPINATTPIVDIDNLPTGDVTITGSAQQNETLTASHTLVDLDGPLQNLTYQWKADGQDIVGATAATYTLVQAQVGKKISVMVSYTAGRFDNSVTKEMNSVVADVDDPTTGSVTIDGTVSTGSTLTANSSLADDDGAIEITKYEWFVYADQNADDSVKFHPDNSIASSDSSNKQLVPDSAKDKYISVRVSYIVKAVEGDAPGVVTADASGPVKGLTDAEKLQAAIKGVGDAALRSCLTAQGWSTLAQAVSLSCTGDTPIQSLQGLDAFNNITELKLKNYPALTNGDLAVLTNLDQIFELDFYFDGAASFRLACKDKQSLLNAVGSAQGDDLKLPTCTDDLDTAVGQIADSNLKTCVNSAINPSNADKLVNFGQLNTLSCADDVLTVKGLGAFTGLTSVTLPKYHLFYKGDAVDVASGDVGEFKAIANAAAANSQSLSFTFADDFSCRQDQETAIGNAFTWTNGSNPALACVDTSTGLDVEIAKVHERVRGCLSDEAMKIGATLPVHIKKFNCSATMEDPNDSSKRIKIEPVKFDTNSRKAMFGMTDADFTATQSEFELGDMAAFTGLEEIDLSFQNLRTVKGLYGTADKNSATQLKKLNLAWVETDNNDVPEAISSLAYLLHNSPSLEALNLNYTRLRPNTSNGLKNKVINDTSLNNVGGIRNSIQASLQAMTGMKELRLRLAVSRKLFDKSTNSVYDGIAHNAAYIGFMPNLEKFEVGQTPVAGNGDKLAPFKTLDNGSQRTNKMTEIRLDGTKLDDNSLFDEVQAAVAQNSNAIVQLDNNNGVPKESGDGSPNIYTVASCSKLIDLANHVTGKDYADSAQFNTGSVKLLDICAPAAP